MTDLEKTMPGLNNLRRVLIVLLPFLIIIGVIFMALKNSLLDNVGGILLFCTFLDASLIALLKRKYYNWSLVFLLVIVIAIIFRSQRWPLTGIFFGVGFTGLGCVSLYSSAHIF